MSNNPAIFDSAYSAAVLSNSAWLSNTNQQTNNALLLATAIDSLIAPIVGGATISQRTLIDSIVKSVTTGRNLNASNYLDIASKIAALFLSAASNLTDPSTGTGSGGGVTSWNGRTGVVVPIYADYDAADITHAVEQNGTVPAQHSALANDYDNSHGVIADTFLNTAARLSYNVTAEDVAQQKFFLDSGDGFTYYPVTTGVNATWRQVVTNNDPGIAGQVIQFYGDASDGDLLITSSDVSLTTEKNYNSISWDVGATGRILLPTTPVAAFPLKCRTLDLTNAPVGAIQCNGINGSNSSGAGGGAAGGTRTLVDGTMLGAGTAGAAGGASSTTTGSSGTVGGALPFGNGGSGGTSGAAGAGNGGAFAGGIARAGGATTLRRRIRTAVTAEQLVAGVAGATGSYRQIQGGAAGGSGSGGGGDGTTASSGGGGSGGGAPVLGIWAKTWIFAISTPASCIQAKGGNGGGAGSGGGGGNQGGASGAGGAGGGYIYALGDSFIGAGLAANTFDVSGGNGGNAGAGAGTGTAGAGGTGGSGGCVDIIQRGVGLIAGVLGVAGAANSGINGGAGAVTRVGV